MPPPRASPYATQWRPAAGKFQKTLVATSASNYLLTLTNAQSAIWITAKNASKSGFKKAMGAVLSARKECNWLRSIESCENFWIKQSSQGVPKMAATKIKLKWLTNNSATTLLRNAKIFKSIVHWSAEVISSSRGGKNTSMRNAPKLSWHAAFAKRWLVQTIKITTTAWVTSKEELKVWMKR